MSSLNASYDHLTRRRYTFEDRQVVDYVREATKKNIWYYRDRMSVPRGPCSLPVLRECWVRALAGSRRPETLVTCSRLMS